MRYILSVLMMFMFIGCVNQPMRINNTMYPQVQINSKLTKKFKDNLVSNLSDLNFYIVSSSQYNFDFRKDYAVGEEATARALMQSVDNSTINSRGIDFYIIPSGDVTTIKAKPYLYKTFNFRAPIKYDMSNNGSFYNQTQVILNIVKDEVE